MENYIIIAIVAVIVGLAAFYIYRAKKSGQKCVGCPYAKSCGSKSCCCSAADKKSK
ncbi:MAG: FeoB-associated Cys-rich membrane protein [Clostridia bacterium]|nr:FeoB-associated Cys-rich membrane protein [Clostridia bacterium]